jgi:hypothetical protein
MPARGEPSPRRVAGHVIGAALLVLAALPAYLTIGQAWRPFALRVACALVVAGGCARARRWVRDVVEAPAVSALDAPAPAPLPPELDGRFARLRDDLVGSTRSRRYFDVILWPRFVALAGSDLPRPHARRGIPRLGPSLRALDRLVARIERRP